MGLRMNCPKPLVDESQRAPALQSSRTTKKSSSFTGGTRAGAERPIAKLSWSFDQIALGTQPESERSGFAQPSFCPQPKLRIGAINDRLEREADRASDQVLRGPNDQTSEEPHATVQASRRTQADIKTGRGVEGAMLSPLIHDALRSPGEPLSAETQKDFDARLGDNFAGVRVHADGASAAATAALNADAFTVGRHIVFGAGMYTPSTLSGKALMAHELTHVLQQRPSSCSDIAGEDVSTSGRMAVLQRKPKRPVASEEDRTKAFKKSPEWQSYVQAFRDLKEANERLEAFKKTEAYAALLRVDEAKTHLAKLLVERAVKMTQLGAAQVDVALKNELAAQAQKRAEDAAIAAAESAKTARLWTRIAGVGKTVANSIELAGVCALAETGIGAVGCIHAFTSLHADLNEVMTGEMTPNAFQRAGHDAAKGLGADEKTSTFVGALADMAGGFASSYSAVSQPRPPSPVGPSSLGGSTPAAGSVSAAVEGSTGEIGGSVPAAVESTASSITGAVPKGEEVFEEISRELGLAKESDLSDAGTKAQAAKSAVDDAEAAGFTRGGEPGSTDLQTQPHGDATYVRGAKGVTGATHESAHVGPTSALKDVPGYSRSAAETTLLPKEVHAALDSYWKNWAIAQRQAGQTQTTAGEIYRVMQEAIQQTSGIAQRTKSTLIWRLQLELFRDLELTPTTAVRLPYPNIKPIP